MVIHSAHNGMTKDYVTTRVLALGEVSISGEVYSWVTVFVLPINSALNPFLYTLMTVVKKEAMLPTADERVQTLTFPKAQIEELITPWQDERLAINIKALGIPAGYQALAGLIDRKALTLRQGMMVGKELLKIVLNLHSRELVQKNLVIDDVFVKLSMSATKRMQVQVVLDARTQLGYMPKSKAENIKSFGNIFDQILEIQTKNEH